MILKDIKFVTYLHILIFLNNRSVILLCRWGWQGGEWSQKLVIFVDVIIV